MKDMLCLKCLLLVRQLLNGGISPDLVNEDGLTALHQVHTQLGNSRIVIGLWPVKHGEPWWALGGDVAQSSRFPYCCVRGCFLSKVPLLSDTPTLSRVLGTLKATRSHPHSFPEQFKQT